MGVVEEDAAAEGSNASKVQLILADGSYPNDSGPPSYVVGPHIKVDTLSEPSEAETAEYKTEAGRWSALRAKFKKGACAKVKGQVGVVKEDAAAVGSSANMVSLILAEIEPGGAGRNVPGRGTESKWAAAHKHADHKLDTLSTVSAEEAGRLLSSTIANSDVNIDKREAAGYPVGSIRTKADWDGARAAGLLWQSDITFQERLQVIAECPSHDFDHWEKSDDGEVSDTWRDFDAQTGEYEDCYDNTCFAGDGLVKMADMETKRVDRLRIGDMLATPDGPRRVALVVVDHVRAK
eukprot:COSAG06_NODE_12035_length_1432_cov_1.453113_2_plen_292_part_01